MQHDVLPRASGQRELEHGACIVAPAAEGGAVDHVGLRIDQEVALGPAVVTAKGLAGGFERMEQLVRPLLVAGAAQTEYGSTIVLAALAGVAIERTIRTEDDARSGALLTQRVEVVKGGVLPLGLARVERPQTKHFGARGAINHAVLDRQRPCRLSGCRWKRVDDAERPRVSGNLRRRQHEHRPAIYASAVIIGG